MVDIQNQIMRNTNIYKTKIYKENKNVWVNKIVKKPTKKCITKALIWQISKEYVF